jgi:16S rRNA processing protein RimM
LSTDDHSSALREVGRTGRAHGVKGDIYVDLITDRTERVEVGARLQVRGAWHTIARSKPAGTRWLVHFEGVDDRNAAEALGGATLMAEPLAAVAVSDELYVHDLIGCEVVDQHGQVQGCCVSVLANPAHDILELDTGWLVPVVFVQGLVDGQVMVDAPEGLFSE